LPDIRPADAAGLLFHRSWATALPSDRESALRSAACSGSIAAGSTVNVRTPFPSALNPMSPPENLMSKPTAAAGGFRGLGHESAGSWNLKEDQS
jgi:hypothetical protein